jgi:hypothetical protein
LKLRRLATLIAVVALVGAACGSAATPAPTPALATTPTPVPTLPVKAAATSAPTATAAPTAADTAAPAPTAAPAAAPTTTPTATRTAGQMTHGRSTHTATALADGRVLVAGGYWDSLPIALADLYDPKTGTFAATGSMATARGFDTATRLADGRVLFAGGTPTGCCDADALIASAELYDPKTGTFSPTGSMKTGRDVHTATLLLDGRVLITGGDDTYPHPVASAELYDP